MSTASLKTSFADTGLGQCELIVAQVQSQNNHVNHLLVTLSFQLDPTRTDQQLQEIAREILEKVLNTLTFREHIICDPPENIRNNLSEVRLSYELRQKPTTREVIHLPSIKLHAKIGTPSIHRQFAPDKTRLESFLRGALSKPEEPLLRAYRSALESQDASAEFIILYAILAAIYDDQQKIDDQIDPGKKERTPSPYNGKPETPFSRVRNELAHPNNRKRSLHEVVGEAAMLRSRIRELVREHLIKHLRLPP